MRHDSETAVEMRGIKKSFDGLSANNNVNFDLMRGEIHALLGENGAGKTTLMNILSGMYHPDEGEIFVKGKKVKIGSPHESLQLGIGMVYQHLTLVPTLTVLENILLGTNRKFLLPGKDAEGKVREISEKFGIEVDPKAEVWQLSAGEQERVEILKLFYRGSDVLILDEPTSVLTPVEVEGFFSVLKRMAEAGKSVIFITHKIEEAISVCRRVTVLRNGEKCGEVDLGDIDMGREALRLKERVVKMMFGETPPAKAVKQKPRKVSERTILTFDCVTAKNDRGVPALKDVSFSVIEGEVFGIAGVDGNGQKELAEVVSGQRKVDSGRIFLVDTDITNMPVRFNNDMGIFYVTDDRIEEGSVANFTVAENAIFRCYRDEPFARRKILLNMEQIKSYSEELIESYSIKAPGADTPVKTLSGGNIQKLVLAREFSQKAALLVCNKPTHGLDEMTVRYIRERIRRQSDRGVSVLLISSDLDELQEVCGRIGVLYRGEMIKILPGEGAAVGQIGRLMMGIID